MRVIPVMDLKDGLAVHALRGERASYQPVSGGLGAGGDPQALAQAFARQLGLPELYIADLDAIQGRGSHAALIAGLARQGGARIMVDAGVTDAARAAAILALGPDKVVIGAETLASWHALSAICAGLPAGRLVFSLDLRGGQVLARSPELAALNPLAALAQIYAAGCLEVILLDLARVGTAGGADLALLAEAHARWPQLTLLAGGGVRHAGDLRALQAAGAAGALVATALHNGAISRQEIAELAGA